MVGMGQDMADRLTGTDTQDTCRDMAGRHMGMEACTGSKMLSNDDRGSRVWPKARLFSFRVVFDILIHTKRAVHTFIQAG